MCFGTERAKCLLPATRTSLGRTTALITAAERLQMDVSRFRIARQGTNGRCGRLPIINPQKHKLEAPNS